ncbi:MAG: hypothetical protein JXR95_02160 [Deltaproteobacteria bacterium]|nr:hypothetical protein [Deltaproteobacteria bacterium]
MKKILPLIVALSLLSLTGCDKQKKTKEFNNYMNKARAVMMEAANHMRKSTSWFNKFNPKAADKYKTGIKAKITEMEALKAKMSALSVPNDEIGAFKKIHVEMVEVMVNIYKTWDEIVNTTDPKKIKEVQKKAMELQKKVQKLTKDEEDLRQKYIKKHGLKG